jgi:hypothetical protein
MKQSIKQILPPIILTKLQLTRAMFRNYQDSKGIDKIYNDRMKNKYLKDRCFIVGTGPSIKEQDLTLLKDEIVIGVSGLFQHKDIDIINPKYYVLPPVFRGHGKLYDEDNFIQWFKSMDKALKDTTVMILDIGDKKYIDKYKIFKDKEIIWKNYLPWNTEQNINKIDILLMPGIWSVSESAIQSALYLGFKENYILGFDHTWYDDIWNHFTDDYMKDFDENKLDDCKEWVDSEHEMIRHAKIFNKYKKLYALKENIYNANANQDSYVDTFPKVKFEDLF